MTQRACPAPPPPRFQASKLPSEIRLTEKKNDPDIACDCGIEISSVSSNGDVTMAEFTALDSLMEMGFSKNRAERALAYTGNQGIERAMDWIMEHESDADIGEPYVPPAGHVLGSDPTQLTLTPSSPRQIPRRAPVLAAAEGSQEEQSKRPLTEEEKQEQIKRLEELMRVKQQEREEREKQEEVERERERRRHGQELLQVKQRLQEEEMKKLAEERKREKIEEKQARQRVRDKIERDKAERAMKFGGGSSSAAPQGPPPAKREYDECRIQVRLLDGSALTSCSRPGSRWPQCGSRGAEPDPAGGGVHAAYPLPQETVH
ncbi:UBX domain-containing protein 1 [Acipenser oxyrinchus oxyrinchus]|uniref:UBX domain-containing protein 1 n=1 Tax=Acipenser oxyrinchus oxyrinchus TaxID=40147 RepID=A0AAD8FQD1_ACIOX|nr:UBX domain-containing protein 1 [Acipenser oxyrinchus oxyrinchus]